MKKLFAALLFTLATSVVQAMPGQGGGYTPFVVVENVATQYVNGEIRFCEVENLTGWVCARQIRAFGKSRRVAQDWWSPQTYAEAFAGRGVQVTDVQPVAGGRGLVIYFR